MDILLISTWSEETLKPILAILDVLVDSLEKKVPEIKSRGVLLSRVKTSNIRMRATRIQVFVFSKESLTEIEAAFVEGFNDFKDIEVTVELRTKRQGFLLSLIRWLVTRF